MNGLVVAGSDCNNTSTVMTPTY
ncbi:hypothetical protein CYM96_004917 [Escherichia coli]|nr:hypothetical protein [Escherichia coli]EEU1789659.1 hypothetical protein [Escherichia coli]EEV1633230.1 hypothetical protein [Escherichia coli]EEV2401471.1 hypothetical protein [Escherichia coli]EEZ7814755.1 hypothetical protein [Escherichia coli]